VGFPDGRRSEECGRDVVPENPTENQRQLGPLVESFSGAQWVMISTGAPRELVIALLSHSVRPLSTNVRPRGWLLSRNVRPLMPLLSRPVD
jgi:glycosyltransferase involved in cell wall biosynthesis